MYQAEANGESENCFTLEQAIYRVYHFARTMNEKRGSITLPDGNVLQWDGMNWKVNDN